MKMLIRTINADNVELDSHLIDLKNQFLLKL